MVCRRLDALNAVVESDNCDDLRRLPLSRRQVLDAAITSLNTIGLAVVGDKEPFLRTILYRPVANTLSVRLVVVRK